jgi:hypothetical protein
MSWVVLGDEVALLVIVCPFFVGKEGGQGGM